MPVPQQVLQIQDLELSIWHEDQMSFEQQTVLFQDIAIISAL